MPDREREPMTGTYRATSHAYGFFTPDGGGEDCFVPPRQNGGAWDGDTVTAQPIPDEEEGRTAVRVTSVIARAHPAVTGILRRENHRCWLEPGDDKLPGPILVTGRLHNAHTGDRAAVVIRSHAAGRGQTPSGELAQIFGPSGEFSTLIDAILYDHGVRPDFPDGVMAQALAVPEKLTDADLAGRTDLRGQTVITIDGASSRDFDDAVSLEREGEDRWRLGVHIADVSHYVPAGTPLDQEAWERGTSVYYADRVVPMLPIALSNGICSLNPQVDRLALSCFMTMDGRGEVLEHSIVKSVIRSTERMTYEDCNVLLAGGDDALEERYAHILPMLRDMAALAAALTRKRRLRGALTLESSELTVLCGEDGEPVGLTVRQPGAAESLIEEFMLAANETVAAHLTRAGMPCVYRVHEKPSADKLELLREAVDPLGYQVGAGDSFALQKVVDQASGKPEAPMINTLLLRAQKKARYDTDNLGHFALAAPCYCHFTSPIRRYPDLMVHRALTLLLAGEKNSREGRRLAVAASDAAKRSSLREVAAAEAEREIEKRYAARFLAGHVGESFPGAVSGVTRFGLFVLLTCGAEGLLPLEGLPEDRYDYNEGTMTLSGTQVEHRYTIGTPLTVRIAAADPESGQVDLALEGVPLRPRERVQREETRDEHREKRGHPRNGKRGASAHPPRKKPGRRPGRGGRKR